jgi:hypothetical protein
VVLRFAAICASLLCAPALAAAPASAAAPRATDFGAAVPLPGAAAAARAGAIVTPVRRAPRRFDLVGFRWRGDAGTVSVRVRRPSGWSAWLDLDATGSGPHGLRESEPAWSGGADAYQLRMTRRARAARAHFVLVTGDRGVLRARAAKGSTGEPAIIPRTAWDPLNQCPPRTTPSYGTVDLAFVHNTVTANDYAPTDTAAIVLAICRYHRNSNGWNDIGYNFLVDKYGQVFEGRAGGTDQAVIGAQAQGYNRFSTGVSAIGTYSTVPFPEPGVQALSRLIAWKLTLGGVPTQGTIVETSGGGRLNRYSAGTPVTLNRIAGHRDGDATDCPGDALYAQLPGIRQLASADAASFGPVARLTGVPGRTSVRFPSGTMVSGTLTVPGGSSAGQTIALQRRAGSTWVTVAQTTTRADGSWTARLAAAWTRTYRAFWGGDGTHAGLATGAFGLTIVPTLAAQAAAPRVRVGRRAVLTGTIAPGKSPVLVTVARKTRGAYQATGHVRTGTSGGRFRISVRLTHLGLYRLTVGSLPDQHNPAAQASPVYVRAVTGAVPGGGAPSG